MGKNHASQYANFGSLRLCTYNKQKETYFFLFACKGKNFILQKQIFKPEILQKKH